MKKSFVFALFLLFTATASFAEYKSGKTVITKQQQEKIRILINNLCGDTWCGGDFNFDFHEFSCTDADVKGNAWCTLSFTMFHQEYVTPFAHKEGGASQKLISATVTEKMSAACEFEVSSYRDVVASERAAILAEEFTGDLNGCISATEDAFSKKLARK